MTLVDVRPDDPALAAPLPERRPRSPLGPGRALLAWVLTALGLLCLWLVLFATVLSGLQAAGTQRGLYDTMREELSLATVPVGAPIDPGAPVALLTSPAAGWQNLVVVEGTSSGILRDGPGHRADTVLPGQAGVAVLYGKGVTYGAPFGPISGMHLGDDIDVVTGFGEFHFTVSDVRRANDPLPPPLESGKGRLTLVSVESGPGLQSLLPDQLVYVDAALVGDPAAGGGGRPAQVSAADQATGTDPAALVPLLLWVQALAVVVVATTWASVRWGGRQTWLVATPILVAVLWGTTNTAMVLVPNLV
jgi:sortase A